ncbi:MAG TPA: DUF5663 domain-containing protein [Candidatus Saccharibacteria bacterium]|nr:DUF5663 domain-containing protein [Candidatus Saccharibacteria bacterium]
MEQIITKELLLKLDTELNGEQLDQLVEHANATLHERIGAEVTSSLNDEQLTEYLSLGDDAAKASVWLMENIPDLKEIIEDERDILLGEIADNTSGIQ